MEFLGNLGEFVNKQTQINCKKTLDKINVFKNSFRYNFVKKSLNNLRPIVDTPGRKNVPSNYKFQYYSIPFNDITRTVLKDHTAAEKSALASNKFRHKFVWVSRPCLLLKRSTFEF